MNRIVLRNCRALVGPDATLSPPVDIVIEGSRIRALAPAGAAAGGRIIDAEGGLAVPGLVNGHFHSGEHFHKGCFENLPLEVLIGFVRLPRPVPLTPRQVYLRTMIGAIEALRTGTTTVVDDLNQDLTPDLRAAVFQAYEDSGIRALVGSAMTDVPYYASVPFLEEEFDAELLAELRSGPPLRPRAFLDTARDLARTRHPRDARVGYILAPSAPQRCTDAFLRETRALADEFDLPVMIHVQESRLQVVHGRMLYGETMIEHLGRIDFLGPDTTLIHAVWLTPREIDLIARTGTTVQHNPLSNMRLGSGLAPVRALLDAGVNVSMGSDGCGSTDTVNMMAVLAAAAAAGKLRGDDAAGWPTAAEMWRAGTAGGALALGLEDEIGAIAPGMRADIVVHRTDRIPFVPLGDAVRQLVHASYGSGIETVIVDGEPVMVSGRLTRIDEAAVLGEITEARAELAEAFAEADRMSRRLQPGYERIHRRSLAEPIAHDTFPARLS